LPPPLEAPEPVSASTTAGTNSSPCALFSTQEVSRVLGLEVRQVERSRQGVYVVCTWRAKNEPKVPSWRRGDPVTETDDGIVTITRAAARYFNDLERQVTATARRRNADAREDLYGIGLGAFAIGGSVSGVPIWNAVARHDEHVTAVEVSGADSRSGIATIKDFLALTIART
jgi:hypothetical protein